MNPAYILASILIVGLGANMWFYRDLSIRYKIQLDSFNLQIEALNAQTDTLRKKYYQVQLEAILDMENRTKETKEILESEVSKDCRKAMRWGIEQNKRMF